jgi:uncharacterized protein
MTSRRWLQVVGAAFLSGVLFAVGLVFAGMTRPSKVLAFLDFSGDWDPSLMWVMLGAVGVNASFTWRILKREAPHFATAFSLPTVRRERWWQQISRKLVVGSALFGIGWGLSGYCPGPALVAIPSVLAGVPAAGVFTAAMIAGMLLFSLYSRFAGSPRAD